MCIFARKAGRLIKVLKSGPDAADMRRTLALLAAAGVAALLLVAVGSTSSAVAAPGTWLPRINTYRAQNGLGPLAEDLVTSVVAQTWTQAMATTNNLAHNPLLAQQVTTPWTRLGENVGYGGDEASLFQAFLGSAGHRANILGAYNAIGIGQAYANGQLWTTHVFLLTNAVLQPPPPPPACPPASSGPIPGAGTTPTGQPTYVSITPARLMDTRPGGATTDGISVGGGALGPCTTRTFTVTGRGGVPATGVGAVVLNVTATGPTTGGYLTVSPAGQARPATSNLNFGPGQTIANSVIAKVGANGQVAIYNDQGSTQVIVDIAGWFPSTGAFSPLSPARLLDTRPGAATIDGVSAGTGALAPGAVRTLTVTGRGGVPASGVGAVVLNLTATSPTAGGYLTVYPAGTARPGTSNLNFGAGQTIPNLVIAKVGAYGQVSIFNASGSTQVIADVAGWFPTTAYNALSPARLLDTRPGAPTVDGISAGAGALAPGATRTLTVTGRGGVPATGVSAVVLNLTVTGPTTGGYLTIFPAGTARPATSNLNFGAGQTIANLVIAKVGAYGQVSIYNGSGSTQVIGDVAGWFA